MSNKTFLLSHYLHRSGELGFRVAIKRAWMRISHQLNQQANDIWWGWIAQRKMSDAALLAKTKGDYESINALLAHLVNRPASSFLFPHESQQETKQLLYKNYPDYISTVVTAADAICENKISLLGRAFQFPNGIDWHKEPVTGWQWPLWHRNRIGDYLGSPDREVDLIFFWEMNRHQHFITLGIAYWLTDDERYTKVFCSQILNWIETNPVQHGLNWYYPLEVSIRVMAWIAAFQFFRHSPQFREKAGSAFLKSLWQQVDFLSKHLQSSREDVPNNHMMAELTGLILAGAAFPEFRGARSWRDNGLRLFTEQTSAQTYPDGVNKEQATGYHRFITELILLVIIRKDIPRESNLEHTLEHMLDYILFSLTPSQKNPMFGDSDYGRALRIGHNKDFWDFRPLLSMGAILFNRPDFKSAAAKFDEESFWLLGTNGLKVWSQLEARQTAITSNAFPDAGLYVIRDSWNPDTDFAIFRCGSFGLGGEEHCAHAHCDLLSFILWVGGKPILIDSGSYIYHGPLRDHFRLTAAHNTVKIDEYEQANPMIYFNWKQIPKSECIDWKDNRVTGKIINATGVEFTRELNHPRQGYWEVSDKFTADNEHTLEWFFHFAPDLKLELQEKNHKLAIFKDNMPYLTLQFPDNDLRCELRESWYSDQYGVKQPNQQLYAIWHGKLKKSGTLFQWRLERINEQIYQTGGYLVETA